MQRVLSFPARLKGGPEVLDGADVPGADRCPFCPDAHRLRRHGHYVRWVLLAGEEGVQERQALVRRLLCPRVGRTVSLLPDVCLPRRQYGSEAVGLFLGLFALLGEGLLEAFRRLRPGATRHGEAQHLVRGFLRRRPQVTAYVGRLRPRVPPPPSGLRGVRHEVAALLVGLLGERQDASGAFREHGVPFHAQFGLGLA